VREGGKKKDQNEKWRKGIPIEQGTIFVLKEAGKKQEGGTRLKKEWQYRCGSAEVEKFNKAYTGGGKVRKNTPNPK